MTSQGQLQGEPYLIYLAAQAGQDEQLEVCSFVWAMKGHTAL